jgi:F0F1-type ATP synthase assembly protein I
MLPELPDRRDMGRYAALGQIGLEMVAPIVVGVSIDRWLDVGPWATVAGAVLGLVGGFVHLMHLLNKMDANDSSPSDREPR